MDLAECNWCIGERHWKAKSNFTNQKQNVKVRGLPRPLLKQLLSFIA